MPLNGSRVALPLVHITYSQTYVIMNRAQTEAIIAETLSRVNTLESGIEGLTGKGNKKAHNARSRVTAEMHADNSLDRCDGQKSACRIKRAAGMSLDGIWRVAILW